MSCQQKITCSSPINQKIVTLFTRKYSYFNANYFPGNKCVEVIHRLKENKGKCAIWLMYDSRIPAKGVRLIFEYFNSHDLN